MRLGSFIAGGLFGAAVVYVMNSRTTAGLMSALSSSLISGMMGNTSHSSSSISNKSSSSGSHASSNAAYSSSSGTDVELEGLKKFKQMIAQDPQLKQTIKDIIKQDETAHSTASKH
jgi:hypothetical protein